MFTKMGSKIKMLAKVSCWIGIVYSVIFFVMTLIAVGDKTQIMLGFLTLVLGPLLSWIGSFVLYGFGELIENSAVCADLAVKQAKKYDYI